MEKVGVCNGGDQVYPDPRYGEPAACYFIPSSLTLTQGIASYLSNQYKLTTPSAAQQHPSLAQRP